MEYLFDTEIALDSLQKIKAMLDLITERASYFGLRATCHEINGTYLTGVISDDRGNYARRGTRTIRHELSIKQPSWGIKDFE